MTAARRQSETSAGAGVGSEVRSIEAMDLAELRAEWWRRWGPPPRFRSRDLLAGAMAHRIQAAAFGDLAAPLKRRMADYAARFVADRTFSPVVSPVLAPGSSVIREWRGVRHEVTVTDTGFAYGGQPFGSLSQVATTITGVKRNGLLFFGLKGTKP